MPTRRFFLAQSALFVPALAGCSAARQVINDQIPAIENPGSLDGKQFPVPVSSGSRVAVSGTGTYNGTFPDIPAVGQQSRLNFAELTQNLRGEIGYTPLGGTDFPTRIVLTDVSLTVKLGDGAGIAAIVPSSTRFVTIPSLRPASGSLTFNRIQGTDRYQWDQTGEIPLGAVRLSGGDAKTLFLLLTERDNVNQNTNAVTATFSASADAQGVSTATGVLQFTFGKGVARVGI